MLDAVRDVAVQGATLQGLAREQDAHAAAVDASRQLAANAERAHAAAAWPTATPCCRRNQSMLRQRDTDLVLLDARLQAQVALVKALGGGYQAGTPSTNPTPR